MKSRVFLLAPLFYVSCSSAFQIGDSSPTALRVRPQVVQTHGQQYLSPRSLLIRDNLTRRDAFPSSSLRVAGNVRRKLALPFRSLMRRVPSWLRDRRQLRKKLGRLVACLCLAFALANPSFAVSGGRMGGSFKSSGGGNRRPSMSRTVRSPRMSFDRYGGRFGYPSYPGRYHRTMDPMYARNYGSTAVAPRPSKPIFGRFSATDLIVISGSTALVGYGYVNNRKARDAGSPLGAGASVASVVVSLDVPDRTSPNCILSRLKRLSERADVTTRSGVQRLVSEVCLEVLRQESSLVSAKTSYQHFKTIELAQKEYQSVSLQSRSKFDRESVNLYNKKDESDNTSRSDAAGGQQDKATQAIVTIHLAIEGDSTKLPKVMSRTDLLLALKKISADAVVEECLLSAEVLWAPEEEYETLTSTDIYADYPDLITLV